MSGTDHGKLEDWAGPTPVFVLVRPQMGENIGAAARAMWNFGLDRMRLVSPRDGWPNPKAVAMASGAAQVIDNAMIAETTADAIGDLNFVFATTARSRDLTKKVLTPEQAMVQARAMTGQGATVGVLFGPERAGLENEDIVQANALISVPVNPAFASLNLAQCVLLTAYEWRRQREGSAAPEDISRATAIEMQKLQEKLEQRLDAAGFFFPENKRASMVLNLRNMLSRMPMTDADTRLMHGVIRALADRTPR